MTARSEEKMREGLGRLAEAEARPGDIDRVVSRGGQLRRRRWLWELAVAAVVVTALSGSVWVGLAGDEGQLGPNPKETVAGATCDVVNDGVPVFVGFPEDSTPTAAPGDTVAIEGAGVYSPATKVEVLWNEDVPGLPRPDQTTGEAESGPASGTLVASGDLAYKCSFRIQFTVPNVPAGRYPLAVRIFDPNSTFYLIMELPFRVSA